MLDFLKKFVRLKTLDLEAKLRPTPACTFGGVGEIEVKTFTDDTATVELTLKYSSAPAGTRFEVYCGGRQWGFLPVSDGYTEEVLSMDTGSLPPVAVGDTAEFRQGDVVLYRGTFKRD